jgi:hypothetical protein
VCTERKNASCLERFAACVVQRSWHRHGDVRYVLRATRVSPTPLLLSLLHCVGLQATATLLPSYG